MNLATMENKVKVAVAVVDDDEHRLAEAALADDPPGDPGRRTRAFERGRVDGRKGSVQPRGAVFRTEIVRIGSACSPQLLQLGSAGRRQIVIAHVVARAACCCPCLKEPAPGVNSTATPPRTGAPRCVPGFRRWRALARQQGLA